MDAPRNTGPVRQAHRFDEARLASYLEGVLDDAGARPHEGGSGWQVRQFKGGQSNPTFWLSDGQRQYVLRKKPPGTLLPSAHAVEREYQVMTALQGTRVPVPRTRHLCEDASVIGTPFFVMDLVAGRIMYDVRLPDLSAAERHAVFDDQVVVLAALHRVDVEAVGLGAYGKPGGYVERQVARWSKQYEASRTGDVAPMEALMPWLRAHVPAGDEVCLTHGDYRLDNLILHPSEPRIVAVIDWELSTLGHPLCDLAYLCMLYHVALPGVGGLDGVDHEATGIPSQEALVARYCALAGRGEIAHWPYYKAFSLFRLAAIVQGVYRRSLQGNASSDDAAVYGQYVRQLAQIACDLIGL